ncbi:helix-turn-helix transcriptional regulator [Phytoactinopolyspora endophytica]|uniref:helix-turn-helix transcriptional regulator n=1 Tax=Phytoactinopolyspora endophytica TaxID=1642495 RepID=UPI0013EA24D8|nr:LuxR family transcriptional regulator [Phytoactinopolyspora endophytica]
MDDGDWGGLVGRTAEVRRAGEVVERLKSGAGGAMVIAGPAGIGKSALLREMAVTIRGSGEGERSEIALAHVVAAEAEREWPYSGVHLVLSGMTGALDSSGQTDIAARGRELLADVRDGVVPYDVATRTQAFLAEMASPLLVVIDDAHLLDGLSQEVLGFVSRRLGSVPAAMMLSTRLSGGAGPFHALPTMELDELPFSDAVRLVRRAAGPGRPRRVAEQIAARAGGNPRLLLDVVGRIPDAQLAGRMQLDRYLPRSSVLEAQCWEVSELDDARRMALTVAAASEDGRLTPVLHALRAYDGTVTEWLLDEHLTEFDGQFAFRRPAAASMAWHLASHRERQEAHAALASAYDAKDRGQQLWHLAQSRYDEDAEIAAELRHASGECLGHGELERATAYARESVRLTPNDAERVDRLVYAGGLALFDGRVEDAIQIARERFRVDTTVQQRADLALLEVRARSLLDGDVAAGVITRHVQEVADADPNRAARLNLFAAFGFACRMEPAEAARFLSLAEMYEEHFDEGTRAVHGRIAAWLASINGDPGGAAALLVVGALGDDVLTEADAHVAHAMTLVRLERFDAARRLLQAITLDGRIGESPLLRGSSLAVLTILEAKAGRLVAARDAAAAWEETGIGGAWRAVVPAYMVRVHGLMGDDEPAWRSRDRSVDRSRRHGDWWATALAQAESGALLLVRGQLDAAMSVLDHARRYALEYADPSILGAEPDYIEACARSGEIRSGASALAEFEQRTLKAPTAWARHTLARCRALLSEGEASLALFDDAVRVTADVSPVEMARTALCYGERLRRMGRRIEAASWLHRAMVMAEECGAAALVVRTEAELRATGRRTTVETVDIDDLTEAEQRIAALVVEGRRNREIAATLFVSVRTVETHLSRIFRKLGVRSRTELAAALGTVNE